ncbi:protein-export membrane protein, SecD/SecF family/protein-export membrane protein SecF [Idiomarina sp. A28L]|uniref:protein translocase subunit SecF n=1 Tax=Idiomarina sp. A28L TaxID=1036674 RepID=UPI0002138647|nr:protein-export membrane protein, SecD/SecF family/protein-export membrane protein SecF [Idiomarina sp. A28L]
MFQITKIDENNPLRFMSINKWTTILSVVLILLSLGSLAVNKLNWGLDFTGGTLVEVGFEQPADLAELRTVLEANEFGDAVVQNYGTQRDVLVRIPPREEAASDTIGNELLTVLQRNIEGGIDVRRVEFVGPQVGEELAEAGGLAMLVALICILVYVSFRFEWRLALSAVAGLAQDVILILGVFSLLQMQVDLTILAALLAVIGYSLNDSIVVADRIRENFRKLRKNTPEEVIDISLSQTLSRTLVTSLTTLLVLLVLMFFGGQMIFGFAVALSMGVIVGTYSSVFTRSTLVLAMGISRDDLMPPEVEKEGEEQDNYL